ncbi:tail fiber assembly protein [Pantoea ananatis]|uniref:tail fiber assembly protein n=1 Tax=Pantoea ananas TaxID=553 RepID=UPI00158F3984|nr:tail fiber assembly protein [Pantoea ananatis]MBA4824081.1 tail fiber assembly protein [Pantoea ananatis]QKV88218.1 tail fiber assembly protein [Pantoea ananatis]
MNDTKKIFDENELATSETKLEVFNYDAISREYTNTSNEYIAKGLSVPAFSTVKPPPPKKTGKTCIYNDNEWCLVDDHRGEVIYGVYTHDEITINELGPYPKNTTNLKPNTKFDVWDGNAWITDKSAQHEAELDASEQKRKVLLTNAKTQIDLWQSELQLGMLLDKDKASLIDWLTYIRKLKEVKITDAPDITWPVPPEAPAN